MRVLPSRSIIGFTVFWVVLCFPFLMAVVWHWIEVRTSSVMVGTLAGCLVGGLFTWNVHRFILRSRTENIPFRTKTSGDMRKRQGWIIGLATSGGVLFANITATVFVDEVSIFIMTGIATAICIFCMYCIYVIWYFTAIDGN